MQEFKRKGLLIHFVYATLPERDNNPSSTGVPLGLKFLLFFGINKSLYNSYIRYEGLINVYLIDILTLLVTKENAGTRTG